MSEHGYITVPNWERFQHYKDRQPAWIKLHLGLLGNDAWLDLRPADRCLLITIWMLVGRYGNGRLNADPIWLYRQANVGLSNRYQGLKRLSDAGFIQVSASTVAHEPASLDVVREEEDTPISPQSGDKINPRANGTNPRAGASRQKRKGAVQKCRFLYRQALDEGDTPERARDWLLNEYRHDPSIVDEAIA